MKFSKNSKIIDIEVFTLFATLVYLLSNFYKLHNSNKNMFHKIQFCTFTLKSICFVLLLFVAFNDSSNLKANYKNRYSVLIIGHGYAVENYQ